MMNTHSQYSNIAKVLHWLVAGLIISQYVLAKLAEAAKANDKILEQLALLANHKSIGITILVLAIIRLAYRLLNKAPALPQAMPRWQKTASHISHILLYGFLFAMPLSGWLMSSAKAYSVSWFNLFALPDFVAPNESLADTLHATHHYLAEALFVVALLHVAAALKHHFIDKDNVLSRMASFGSWGLLFVTCVVTVGIFGRLLTSGPAASLEQTVSGSGDAIQVIESSSLPIWNIDYADSYIKFSGDQAGAAFTGEWKKWSADIQFDTDRLDQARFNVTIDTSSGFSNDQERDDTIRSPEFFDVEKFKQARYLAQDFVRDRGQFKANGQLLMKGASSGAVLTFAVNEEGGKKVLTGTAPLNRLVWNIGTGDWTDTSWVGQEVTVSVRVVATP